MTYQRLQPLDEFCVANKNSKATKPSSSHLNKKKLLEEKANRVATTTPFPV